MGSRRESLLGGKKKNEKELTKFSRGSPKTTAVSSVGNEFLGRVTPAAGGLTLRRTKEDGERKLPAFTNYSEEKTKAITGAGRRSSPREMNLGKGNTRKRD